MSPLFLLNCTLAEDRFPDAETSSRIICKKGRDCHEKGNGIVNSKFCAEQNQTKHVGDVAWRQSLWMLIGGFVIGIFLCALPHQAVATEAAPAIERSLAEFSPAELQVRYAEQRLELAKLNLERAEQANRLIDRAVGQREIHRLSNHVDLTKRQLAIAKENPRTTAKQTNLASAEIAVANARGDLATALKANKRTTAVKAAAVSKVNIARLQTILTMAEIRLEMVKRPDYVPSMIDEMQWHIDQLTNEVIDLRHQLEAGGNLDFGAERP